MPISDAMEQAPKNERRLHLAHGAKLAAIELVDAGPFPLADIAGVFAAQHPNVLASAWAAILVDSLSEAGLRNIGEICRAFNVVVLKLNHRPAQYKRRTCKTGG